MNENDCGHFARRGIKTRTQADWRAEHDAHNAGVPYAINELEGAPEDYEVYWLICACGARLATKRSETS